MNLEPYQRSTLQERNSRIYKETNKKMTSSEKFTYKDIRQQIDQQFIEQGWVTVSDSDIYSALIPDTYLEKSLKTEYWDITEYSPQLWASCNRDNPTYEYKRYENGIEPLVILRDSRGKYPSEINLSEEFILYFNLRKNTSSDYYDWELVTLSYDGEDIAVARCLNQKIEVSVKYLKHFIAIKEMNLAIYFNYERFLNSETFDSQYSEPTGTHKDQYAIFRYSILQSYDFSRGNICSELMGKLIIPYDKSYKGISLDSDSDKYEEYIIDIDSDGNLVHFTCDSRKLSNFFTQIPGAPMSITPIYFKKSVLDKYYNNPSKYSVRDGYLTCDGYWSLKIDNNHTEYVVVLLVDLGKLHYKEQLHWKCHNITKSKEMGLSEPAYAQWIEGRFSDGSTVPDLILRERSISFNNLWKDKFGWDLYIELSPDDKYKLDNLHLLTTDYNPSDFEAQVLSSAIIFIDSLNKKAFESQLDPTDSIVSEYLTQKKKDKLSDLASLDCLELFLKTRSHDCREMMDFLRKLQLLRSTGVAHRKSRSGTNKAWEYFELDCKNHHEVLEDIFIKLIKTLNTLELFFLKQL